MGLIWAIPENYFLDLGFVIEREKKYITFGQKGRKVNLKNILGVNFNLITIKPMTLKLSLLKWSDIKWPTIQKTVKSYRSEIFLATKSGDTVRLRILQKKALSNKSILLWAIRRITSINQGKKEMPPGLDNSTYLTNEKRWKLFQLISRKGVFAFKPLPVKRIHIPKANGKLRPLGIPIIIDRVIQFVTLTALEPEWEAKFEHCSYGFRPARGCHDAMIRVYKTLNSKVKTWILEADIKGCFDTIAHAPLLKRLEGFPGLILIEQWLKAGFMEKRVFNSTDVGTPQGGAISPLLSNIALHGMEQALGIKYKNCSVVGPYTLIRYADDFVVMCKTYESALKAKEILTPYLGKMGLSFSEEKTLITDARLGFNLLGWTFRIFSDRRKPSKEVTLVHPSQKSIANIKAKLKVIWRAAVGRPIGPKIRNLNAIIIGWANYHKYVNSNDVFRSLDHFQYKQAIRFARRQHSSKGKKWIRERYFKTLNRDRWTFYDQTFGFILKKFRAFKILNFLPVKYGMLPDDPSPESVEYFSNRKRDQLFTKFSTNKSMLKMFKAQGRSGCVLFVVNL